MFDAHSMNLGKKLKQARQQKGMSLQNIAKRLNIAINYLEAIENDNWRLLPGHAYAVGFARIYGRYLGIDTQAYMGRLKAYFENKPQTLMEVTPRWSSRFSLAITLILFVIFLAAGLFAFKMGIFGNESAGLWQKKENIVTGLAKQQKINSDDNIAPLSVDARLPDFKDTPAVRLVPDLIKENGENNSLRPVLKEGNLVQNGNQSVNLNLTSNNSISQKLPQDLSGKITTEYSDLATFENQYKKLQTKNINQPLANGSTLLRALDDVWVRVERTDGEVIFSDVMRAGQYFIIPPSQSGALLNTADAGKLVYQTSEKTIKPISPKGGIVIGFELDKLL